MGKLGLFGLPFPEDYGGMGGDYFALCLALEELARVDSSVAITLEAGVSLGAMPIYRFGTAEQRRRWLPELCTGERLAAFGLTEPGGGSDIPGGMRTTARLEEGQGKKAEWVVDGSKSFITNSGTAITSLVTVLAITGQDDRGGKEISSVIVPAGTRASSRARVLQGRLVRLGRGFSRLAVAVSAPVPAGPGVHRLPPEVTCQACERAEDESARVRSHVLCRSHLRKNPLDIQERSTICAHDLSEIPPDPRSRCARGSRCPGGFDDGGVLVRGARSREELYSHGRDVQPVHRPGCAVRAGAGGGLPGRGDRDQRGRRRADPQGGLHERGHARQPGRRGHRRGEHAGDHAASVRRAGPELG